MLYKSGPPPFPCTATLSTSRRPRQRISITGPAGNARWTPAAPGRRGRAGGGGVRALLLTHGWPNSFVEFTELIGPLTDPRAHGGDPGQAFHVVVPSMPGFGFSAPPPEAGFSVARIGRMLAELMRRLGHDRRARGRTPRSGCWPG
ncbi:hypothetical protein DKT69_31665 [Micromonospora sicca]|uniref:AB hydrolase-1 domain-containing protein n=1 Tax=Micromonospora sicca TaxID=2202420 RepID=A0A317D482_9ACTN|nr:alpha/beta fold hydrolase [Micromonospora sp. ATA51]PWR09152.1 hypothetical protein DKT69_31665 [Micromonospora sp. 4G51]